MKQIIIDASVAVKWFVQDPQTEPNHEQALVLLRAVVEGRLQAQQPVHWLPELAAVLARLLPPDDALPAIELATALELNICDQYEVLQQAARMAIELKHHLFDTLYHAVALGIDGVLITADERYYSKAQSLGHIQRLADWGLN